ncbi:MAG TPA: CBO2463/CBO2479 domain-containing protein [Selenomonadales bacterium]|nr:CBO2463/CBO2479 domain-containing protein [Selenomonadales bacterium]
MEIDLTPRLMKGKIVEVTDVGVKITFSGRLGVLSVPLRMVFTDKPLAVDDDVELYISYIQVVNKPKE